MDPETKTQFSIQIRQCALRLGREGAAALGGLYDLTAARLIRYACMLTRHPEDAEDALQAAMLQIARKPELLAEARHPWAYCLQVVRREALKIVRKRKPIQPLAGVADDRRFDERVLESWDLCQYVRSALAKLPPAQAEVVVLKVWEEMTFAEIGEVLGQSPNTAASRYRYALQKLTGHLELLSDEVLDD